MGLYINFIHCFVLRGLDPSWERFPASVAFSSAVGEFSATIFCGRWRRRAPALPGLEVCVCCGDRSRGDRLGTAQCLTAPASLHQSAAKVWPLCGFGGRVPVGAPGWRENWAVNKAGSRQVPPSPAWAGPLCCSQAPAADGWGGFGLGEASGATAGACGGCPRCAAPVP